jgi:hypothetical protein
MNPRTLILIVLLLPGLLVALPPCAVASATWYVDGVSGSDSNNCLSPPTACKTIGHAISLASSGDSIIVAPATYTESLTIGISLSVIGSGARTTIIDGGGVQRVVNVSSGTVTLAGLTIRNGFVSWGYGGVGAGILNSGNLLVIASTITGNLVSGICPFRGACNAAGGGIYNSIGATLTLRNSTVSRNMVQTASTYTGEYVSIAQGGGVFNRGSMSISNSTVAGNTARRAPGNGFVRYYGGGISNIGTVIISNSTINGNTGGGISSNVGFAVTLQNSIVSNNAGSNCSSGMVSNGYNLSSDGTCNFNSRGDLNNHDPLLGPLQNNGGPTDTMALLTGSLAIDAGNPGGCTDAQGNLLRTDQRGMPRPDKEDASGCDMGAFESQSD